MEMEMVRITLRTGHIVSGTLWVGAALFITFFLEPAVRGAGAEGGRFMTRLVTQTPLMKYMILSSLLTVFTGLALYWLDARLNLGWISSSEGIIFTVGAVAGLVAYGTGQFVVGPTSARIGALGHEMAVAGGPPSPTQVSQMSLLQGRAIRAGRLEAVLMFISVAGMAGARLF